MTDKKPTVSIVIPCYNEAKKLEVNMQTLIEHLQQSKIDFELLLVNDGSTDETLNRMKRIKNMYRDEFIEVLDYGKNRGKGYAVRYGMEKALADKIFFMDADLSTDVEHIKFFIELLEKHQIVIGSRKKPGKNIVKKQGAFRVLVGKVAKSVTSAIVDLDFYDTQCGFKAFNKEVVDVMLPELTIDRFCFDVEMLYVCKLKGYGFEEVPVNWSNDADSSVNPIRDGIKFVLDLVKIRIIHRKKVKK